METSEPNDLQIKYQKLAAEYSKLRSQAQVLKKGVVDEQTRNSNLTEIVKEYEQKVRKADLEMESLNFRNQQLTKRIIVLQEELDKQAKQKHKGNKHVTESVGDFVYSRNAIIDEELKSKIIENAQLLTTISDKDVIISTLEDRVKNLEIQNEDNRTRAIEMKDNLESEVKKLRAEVSELNIKLSTANEIANQLKIHNGETRSDIVSLGSEDTVGSIGTTSEAHITEQLTQARQQIVELKQELELYKIKCKQYSFEINNLDESFTTSEDVTNILGSVVTMPASLTYHDVKVREQKLVEYFLERINDLVKEKESAKSVCDNITAEYNAIEVRLEESLTEKLKVEEHLKTTELSLESLQEELSTTSHNYELQLSTMSEHLANMNDTLTKQCDEIQQLKFSLSLKRQTK